MYMYLGRVGFFSALRKHFATEFKRCRLSGTELHTEFWLYRLKVHMLIGAQHNVTVCHLKDPIVMLC